MANKEKVDEWLLNERQGLALSHKITMTEQRVKEWYKHWGGKIYVAFSGGKDSTALLHIVRKIYPKVVAVFVDTGLEYPEIREFVSSFDNVIWLRPKMPFHEVIKKYGYPVVNKEQSTAIYEYRHTKLDKVKKRRLEGNSLGRVGMISKKWQYLINAPFGISAHCCNIMKKNPSKKFEKQTGYKPLIGIMAGDSQLRKRTYHTRGCFDYGKRRPTAWPIAFWLDADIWAYIHQEQIPYVTLKL